MLKRLSSDEDRGDPSLCPLCRQPNRCAMACGAAEGGPCWCTELKFPAEVLASIPPQAQGKVCICRACAEGAPR